MCKAASFVGKDKVGGDGSVSNGWWIVGGGVKDFNSGANDGDPFIAWGRELLADAGVDYHTSGSFGSGFIFSWAFVQAVRIAGELDGGLTRPNLILALRTMDMTHPMNLPGIGFNMNGNADALLHRGLRHRPLRLRRAGLEAGGQRDRALGQVQAVRLRPGLSRLPMTGRARVAQIRRSFPSVHRRCRA